MRGQGILGTVGFLIEGEGPAERTREGSRLWSLTTILGRLRWPVAPRRSTSVDGGLESTILPRPLKIEYQINPTIRPTPAAMAMLSSSPSTASMAVQTMKPSGQQRTARLEILKASVSSRLLRLIFSPTSHPLTHGTSHMPEGLSVSPAGSASSFRRRRDSPMGMSGLGATQWRAMFWIAILVLRSGSPVEAAVSLG